MLTSQDRSYTGLLNFRTFDERFDYLALNGGVGHSTFGHDRYLNQQFYQSYDWRRVRNMVITRDEGRDLGVPGYELYGKVVIHHIIPMTPEDILNDNPLVLDIDNLITVSHETHNAIHYGSRATLQQPYVERSPNDHILW